MALLSIRDVREGAIVSFRSKDPTDTVVWQGVLESIGTYRSVKGFGDQRSANERVRQVDNTVSSDLSDLTWFRITTDNKSSQPDDQVFADEWIAPGSLNNVSLGKQVTLLVDDPKDNVGAILSLLASAGYHCKVKS